METNTIAPREVFERFSKAMYAWNLLCLELKKNNELDDETKLTRRKEKLDEIFDKFVTVRQRANGRQAGYNFRNPPEYDPLTNEIVSEEIDGNKAFIEVQESVGFNRRLRYTLHYKTAEWRVDKRERFDDVFKNKWVADII